MAGDPNRDLQAWLDALKKKAQDQSRGAPASPPRPASPAPRPVAPSSADAKAKPQPAPQHSLNKRPPAPAPTLETSRAEVPNEIAAARRHDAQRAELERRAEEARRLRAEAAAEANELRLIRAEEKKQQAAVSRRESELEKKRRLLATIGPKSSLGLSGDLIHDLRENPTSLREAVLLLEILGPPPALRDPFERLV